MINLHAHVDSVRRALPQWSQGLHVQIADHQPAEDPMAAGADCVIDNFLGDAKAKLELIRQRSAADPPDETLPVASPTARG